MNKKYAGQRVRPHAAKKTRFSSARDRDENVLDSNLKAQRFIKRTAENVLGTGQSQTYRHGRVENASELAQIVCKLGNAGRAVSADKEDAEQRLEEAEALLIRTGWQTPNVDIEDLKVLYPERADFISESVAESETHGYGADSVRWLATMFECDRVAFALDQLIKEGKVCVLERHLRVFDTERIQRTEELPFQASVFEQVFANRRINPRRFARCAACQAFFYKPRMRSRACSRKCENALMSRAHYQREKERREKALALYAQGSSSHEIARTLDFKRNTNKKAALKKVCRYLTERSKSTRKKADG
jgi:hypothetical protein